MHGCYRLQSRGTSDVDRYGREDVLRILRVPSRQLANWQRAGLVSTSEDFSFEQLVQLRKLRDLTAM